MWHNVRLMNLATTALCALGLLVFAFDGLCWLAYRPLFTLRTIRIEADRRAENPADNGASGSQHLHHVNAATIKAAALPRILNDTKANFFNVKLDTVRQAFESVAWVRHARVQRVWPDKLLVKLEEHRVLGAWNDGRLINVQGELFAANLADAEEENDLPDLSGPPGSEKLVVQRYLDFTHWFAPLHLTPDEVTLSQRYAWTLKLSRDNDAGGDNAGLTVQIGREENSNTLPERVGRLITAYPLLLPRWPKLTQVDLRYPKGFAMRAEGLQIAGDKPDGADEKKPARPNAKAPKPVTHAGPHHASPTTSPHGTDKPNRVTIASKQ